MARRLHSNSLGRWALHLGAAFLLGLLFHAGALAQETPTPQPNLLAPNVVRPPELNRQLRRAETAWRSGASVLEAKARVDRVLEELPNDADARKLRAQVLLALGRPAEALRDAQHAARLMPRDGEAHLILCEAARRVGRHRLAEQALDAAAALDLDDAALHVRLSWNAAELGRLGQAEALARIAHAQDPNDPNTYYQLARIFTLTERPDAAASILERGLRADIVEADVVLRDSVLGQLARHRQIAPLLR